MNDTGRPWTLDPIEELPSDSEIAMALRFAEQHRHRLQYVPAWGWLEWTGTHWRRDEMLQAFDLAREVCREEAALAQKPFFQKMIASAKSVAAVERLARADRRLVASVEIWDRDPWLLPCPGGIIDLRTGHIRPAAPSDYMTMCAASVLAPEEDCPTWKAFLMRICAKNMELIDYIKRVCGYMLTGIIREHVLFFAYGGGANGKTVFTNTSRRILGDYARPVAMDLLVEANKAATGPMARHVHFSLE
jgi:phage/plasmid-associated DNA primase